MNKRPNQNSLHQSALPLVTASLALAGLITHTAHAQIQSAGALLVDVDATAQTLGALKSIKNNGSLGGIFSATGAATTVPTIATEGGTKGIRFDGTDFLQLVTAEGGPVVDVPEGLVGEDATSSIEVWVLNPQIAGEETLVSWGKRGGGPDGSNMSFNYGSDGRWGAMGHWGNPDLGWNNAGGAPTANKWHHLVFTYDGTTSRAYADGTLANFEYLGNGVINTHPATSINIATQLEADGVTPTGGLRLSGTIAKVRVHDGVLSADQIKNNYNTEKAAFVDPQPPSTLQPERLVKGPIHRYSFDEAAKADASGSEFKDSIGSAHGKVVGPGAAFTGSRLRLTNGGPSADSAYGDLPNGLLSSRGVAKGGTGEFAFETWFRNETSRTWSRVFDFGSTAVDGVGGELDAPGGGGQGLDYLVLSAQIGNDVNARRLEVRNEDPAGGGVVTADTTTRTFNTEAHILLTWKEDTGRITLFENGKEIGGATTTAKISDINDVNVWLGRSNWTADQNTQGEYNEVRVYDYVLTPAQALGNFLAGPDLINNKETPVTLTTQPASQTIPETLPVVFRVEAQGSSPVNFQWMRNGTPIAGANGPSYTIDAVSAADNGAKFSVKITNTVAGKEVAVTSNEAVLTVNSDTLKLKHRYSFSETSGNTVKDSVSNANGTVFGAGSKFENGQLSLDGTGDGYVDLPNNLVTSLGKNATIEFWYTWGGGPVWSRVFDFGASTDGEDTNNGGTDYLFYTPRNGDGWPIFVANFPNGGDTTVMHHPGSSVPGAQEHVVITYSSTGNTARMFSDGVLIASGPASKPLSDMANGDNNVWLGRSQYNDPFVNAKYNEFRIYEGAMTPSMVAASFAAGPDKIAEAPQPNPGLSAKVSGANVVVSWPGSATGFALEGSSSLGAAANWTRIGDGTPANNGVFSVTVPIDQSARFLRLRK